METDDNMPQVDHIWQVGDDPRPGEAVWPSLHVDDTGRPYSSATETGSSGSRPAPPSSGGPVLWSMGLLMGAVAMYLLDAENGERRRAVLAQRVDWYRGEMERTIERERTRVQHEVERTV